MITLENVAVARLSSLVEFYNMNSNKPIIKKFRDRETAVARVTAILKAQAPAKPVELIGEERLHTPAKPKLSDKERLHTPAKPKLSDKEQAKIEGKKAKAEAKRDRKVKAKTDKVETKRDRKPAKTAKAPAVKGAKRMDEVLAILQVGGGVTIEALMAKFDTAYKNITGDFYHLRKAGFEVKKVRIDGETRFFVGE